MVLLPPRSPPLLFLAMTLILAFSFPMSSWTEWLVVLPLTLLPTPLVLLEMTLGSFRGPDSP